MLGPLPMTEAVIFQPSRRRRRRVRIAPENQGEEIVDDRLLWAPKWRRLLSVEQPADFVDFDRTVRGMLNRISTVNAARILPLEPGLRMVPGCDLGGDCPPWWAARFSALMLNSYLEVIHTNRAARGIAKRSADNVLPEYVDAVAPLLQRSPRLVASLMAWLARALRWEELTWPTARLLWLAAKDPRAVAEDAGSHAPAHALCRLPPELVRGRILSFLRPTPIPAVEDMLNQGMCAAALAHCDDDAGFMDATAVLAHVVAFTPASLWPGMLAFSLELAQVSVSSTTANVSFPTGESKIFLAATLLVTVAHRLDSERAAERDQDSSFQHAVVLNILARLADQLSERFQAMQISISSFVASRVHVALDHFRRMNQMPTYRL